MSNLPFAIDGRVGRVGDVVKLRSGGDWMTVVGHERTGWFGVYTYRAVCVRQYCGMDCYSRLPPEALALFKVKAATAEIEQGAA